MVGRGTHLSVSHRLSGVCSNSSGSHWSQRRHHKEGFHCEGVLSELVEKIKDKNTELEEVTSGARVVDDQDAEVERLKGEIKT